MRCHRNQGCLKVVCLDNGLAALCCGRQPYRNGASELQKVASQPIGVYAMGKINKRLVLSLLISAFYGLCTLVFTLVIMPRTGRIPELARNILLFGVPAVAVLPLIKSKRFISPFHIFMGIPVQYLALYFCAEFIAQRLGLSVGGLSGFTYFHIAVTRPIFFTLEQFLVLFIARNIKKSKPAPSGS